MGKGKGDEKSKKIQLSTTQQQNEKKNLKDENDKNHKKSKRVSNSSFVHPSVVLFVFVSLPCLFLAGMLFSSLISPAADAFWHRHFWYRILPLPSKEYLQKNPWAALAMDMMYDQPLYPVPVANNGENNHLTYDITIELHKNGHCCSDGLVIQMFEGFTWKDIQETLKSNLPNHLKDDTGLKFFSDDFEITSIELLLESYHNNNIIMKKQNTRNNIKQMEEAENSSHLKIMYVRSGTLFVWSTRAVGYKFQPSNVNSADMERPIELETLSSSPRVFRVSNFLSNEEIEYLKKFANDKLQRSSVGIGKQVFHNDRTSRTAWDTSSETSLKIQQRAYDLIRVKYQQNKTDAIQIIRYLPGQTYVGHTDYFNEGYDNMDPSQPDGTNRFMTLFCYLSDVPEGGATVFPQSTSHLPNNSAKYLANHNSILNLRKNVKENDEECEILQDGSSDCSKKEGNIADIDKLKRCIGFKQTKNCDPNAELESEEKHSNCDDTILYGRSGYCQCGGGRKVMQVSCEHSHFTCKSACAGKNSGVETTGNSGFDEFLRECGSGNGLAVYPKKGDAILFYSQTPDAILDPKSFHGGCPIIKGGKWGANVWVWNRARPFFGKKTVKQANGKYTVESTSIHLSFLNRRATNVDLYWLNHNKQLQKFHTFLPGGSWNVNSHLGHVWVARQSFDDTEVGRWVATRKLKKIEI